VLPGQGYHVSKGSDKYRTKVEGWLAGETKETESTTSFTTYLTKSQWDWIQDSTVKTLCLNVWIIARSYEGCSKRFAPHYFSRPLTKIEKCSFEGLKYDVSPTHILSFESFRQIAQL
jgi:hypothetical protein